MNDRERMVISAHSDGEVEAPWTVHVEKKIAEDPAWASEAAAQAQLRSLLARAPEPDFTDAAERVRSRVLASTSSGRRSAFAPAWVSVAAAALLLAAAGGGYWAGRQSSPSAPAEVAELKVQVPRQLSLELTGEGQLFMASTLDEVGR